MKQDDSEAAVHILVHETKAPEDEVYQLNMHFGNMLEGFMNRHVEPDGIYVDDTTDEGDTL